MLIRFVLLEEKITFEFYQHQSLLMKKHLLHLLFGVLFFLCAAMSCEEGTSVDRESFSGALVDFELTHLDNAGERPQSVTDGRVKKEAYVMKISLLSEPEENTSSIDKTRLEYLLTDPIVNIRIFTETNFSEKYPAGADVSSLFYNYPRHMGTGQIADNDGSIKRAGETSCLFKALVTAPAQSGTYCFRVKLIFKSGDSMEKTTEPLVLY